MIDSCRASFALFLPTITYVVSQASEGLVGKVLATVGIVP